MTFWFFWNVNKNSLQIYKYTEVSLPIPMIVIKKGTDDDTQCTKSLYVTILIITLIQSKLIKGIKIGQNFTTDDN